MGTSGLNDIVADYVPWRKGVQWWVVAVQGILLMAIGGFALWQAGTSIQVVLAAMAGYFVLSAIWTIVKAMRGIESGFSVFGLLAAGGGLVSGIAVLIPAFLDIGIDYSTLFYSFGIAQVVMGLLMVASAFFERPDRGVSWIGIFRGVVVLVLGSYILYALRNVIAADELQVIRWIAIGAVIVGVLLCIYAFTLYREKTETPAPVS